MAQQIISDGESGLASRNAINANFTELYAINNVAIKQPGITGNLNQTIDANTFVQFITIFPVAGTPVIRIGTTPNGVDLMDDTLIDNSQSYYPVQVQQYFLATGTIYFTFTSGSGTIDIRIDILKDYN